MTTFEIQFTSVQACKAGFYRVIMLAVYRLREKQENYRYENLL